MLIQGPFGSRSVQGLVIARDESAPVSETRPVTRLLVPDPVLDQHQLDLGLWLSRYYCTPLIDCLRLMLPPGMLRQPRSVLRLHPDVPLPADLSPSQQEVVELLERHGALSRGQIAHRVTKSKAQHAIRALVRRGILIRSSNLPAPRARPKRVNFVRLIASPPQVEGVRPMLGRTSKQGAILQVLLDRPDPLPTTNEVLAHSDASSSTLSTVANKGWVEIVPQRKLVLKLPAADSADLDRAPKQRAIIDYLAAHPGPIEEGALRDATEASTSTVATLEKRGLIQRLTEPSTVLLNLSESKAKETIIDLRNARRQHQVLDYLLSRPVGEWIWVSWVYAETDAQLADLRALEGHGIVELAEREMWRDPLADRDFVLKSAPKLTPDQARAWSAIAASIRQSPTLSGQAPPVFLLHGVTGSGKTEVYMRAVSETLAQGRQAIVLVPEISLTPQTIRRFAARFPEGLGVMHSGLSDGERYDTWRRIRAGQIQLVIGPRSALFAPLRDIGLIVLDEEHESSYKQGDVMPAYHARQVARRLARIHGSVVVLGSATPDLSTYYDAQETNTVQLLTLSQRLLSHRRHIEAQQAGLKQAIKYKPLGLGYEDVYTIAMPPVRIVDMRHELRAGNRSMFSRPLQRQLRRALENGEQAILFLNRRGASTFVMCRDCGTVIHCPRCDVPLTFHLSSQRLNCHHCNHQAPVPKVCPICQSRRIKYFGVGTQRVEAAVQELLPDARLLRWDRDTTREKGSHQALLEQFAQHRADILIGTQMIAKGLDLPLVTLVGVVAADTALNLPDFRAAERTFQLLAQVAGRAGRGPRGGAVIIQTYNPDHYAIQAAAEHDYDAFYARERAFRDELDYPPFARLARLIYADSDAARARDQAKILARTIEQRIAAQQLDSLSLIGPAPCFLHRLRGRWRWQILIRSSGQAPKNPLHQLLHHLDLDRGWQLDIDPLDVL
jgi:primosomal protein N' (replication factor Y)